MIIVVEVNMLSEEIKREGVCIMHEFFV